MSRQEHRKRIEDQSRRLSVNHARPEKKSQGEKAHQNACNLKYTVYRERLHASNDPKLSDCGGLAQPLRKGGGGEGGGSSGCDSPEQFAAAHGSALRSFGNLARQVLRLRLDTRCRRNQ